MRVRCLHCHDPIELDDAVGLDCVSCPACGESFKLVGDETLPLAPEAAGAKQPPLRTLGRFELIQQLGKGGYGTVWLARDPELDRLVAVKVPRTSFLSAEETEQFLREARAAAQLHHPNIVSVHEIGRHGDTVFIVSDYVRGRTLSERLVAQRMSAREAAEMTAKLSEALDHAHEKGVIHRDLKPGNIMVAQPLPPALSEGSDAPTRAAANGPSEPYIMDFGLARREAGELTVTVAGQVLGTPHYMSPEQARGESHQADRRSDIYSLGVIFYAMLTGELPFRGNASMLVHQILNDEPSSLRRLDNHVPRDLETICLKCLHKNPERRYQRAAEVAADLRRWLHHEPIHARPVGRLERAFRWSHRKPWAAAALVLLVSIVVLTSYGMWRLSVARAQAVAANEQTKQAQEETERTLRNSLYREAQAHRLSYEAGRRWEALRALERAAEIEPGIDLRDEYLRCLDLPDVRPKVDLHVPDSEQGIAAVLGNDEMALMVPMRGQPVEFSLSTGKVRREFTPLAHLSNPAALSPDARFLAAARADGTALELWDIQVPKRIAVMNHPNDSVPAVRCLAFNQNAQALAAVTKPNQDDRCVIAVYSIESPGKPQFFDSAADDIDCLRFSPDGKWLAASAKMPHANDNHSISLWSVARGEKVAQLHLEEQALVVWDFTAKPCRIDFSPNGELLAASGALGTVKIWRFAEFSSGERDTMSSSDHEVLSVPAHYGQALAAQFSPDGRWLATSGDDRSLKIWDTETSLEVARASLATPRAHHLQWSPSGVYLFSATSSGIRCWEFGRPLSHLHARRGQLRNLPEESQRILGLEFSPTDRWLAWARSNQQTVALIDLQRPDAPSHMLAASGTAVALSFSNDHESLWAAMQSNTHELWQPKSGDRLSTLEETDRRFLALAFNAKGQRIAAGLVEEVRLAAWNLDEHKELFRRDLSRTSMAIGRSSLNLSRPRAADLRISRDASHLALITPRQENASLEVFDLGADVNDPVLSVGVPRYQSCIALSSGGRFVAVGQNKRIFLYDVLLKRRINNIEAHDADVTDLAFDESARLLVSAALDGTVRLWNTVTCERVTTLYAGRRQLRQVAVSPSARWLAVADSAGSVCLWNLAEARAALKSAKLDW